jgi:hypothetical protein
MLFATVTPSLVTLGDLCALSIITFLPCSTSEQRTQPRNQARYPSPAFPV